MKSLIKEMCEPVDPDTFIFMLDVFQNAARMNMPTQNPETVKFDIDGSVVSFTDIPMNRGLLEVALQLSEIGIDSKSGYLTRIMHMYEIVGDRDKFLEFFKPGDDDESFMVSDVLLRAAAVAKFEVSENRMGFDLDDVLSHAQKLAQEAAK
ncbi:MAG: hypothetical protein LBE24_04125 [Methylobacillus sp.]|jgi:hypothetical protein|nr:hypothetical protein [Methylobacillus sp.]